MCVVLSYIQFRTFCLLKSKSIKIKIQKYRTVILPAVLYGCETYFQTLRKEHRVRVFENMMLRRILGSKRDDIKGGLRKVHKEELLCQI
jgi:hypothetical protein